MKARYALLLCAAGLAGALLWLDARYPPDLRRLADLSTVVEARDGSILRAFANGEGRWRLRTTVDDVPAHYLTTLKAYEDQRFESHFGVDPIALVRAAVQNATAGQIISGASTLTMQVARLLEPRPRNLTSKLVEMVRAVQLEWRYRKRDILDMYLTLAPFGGAVEGVRAASLVWFGKPARALTPGEAALLVALPQAPSNLRPDRWPERARAARDKILDRVAAVIGPDLAREAREDAIPDGRRALPFRAVHLAQTLRQAEPGQATIRTTVDPALQDALEALVRREDSLYGEKGSVAALVVDNAGRGILAHVGGLDLFDPARAGFIDLVQARRSPGSVLKPFLYGLAFDDRILHPETLVADVPTRFGDYRPDNFDGQFRGDLSVREALQRSLNVPAVAVLQELGPLRFTHALQRAGARLAFPREIDRPRLPVVLGGMAISLHDVVTLYAGLANGGVVAPLRAGATQPLEGVRLLSPNAAAEITEILRGTPVPPGLARMFSRRNAAIAYKTGTSYGYRDAWAAGYTSTHTVGVWVGRPDGTPMPGHFGRATAAPLLFRIFDLLPEAPTPALVAASAGSAAPPALRRFSVGDALRQPATLSDPDRLEILFPPDGATLDRGSGQETGVPLRAGGGQRPLTWLIDGRPIESTPYRREALWRPEGSGFFRATVIDARGVGKSVEFRVR